MTTPRAARAAFVGVVLISVAVLFSPASTTPSALPPGVDKAVHLVLFAALAWTGRRAGVPVAGLAAGLVAYAGVSEVLQGALPLGRSADVLDALVDVVGVAVGLAVARRPVHA